MTFDGQAVEAVIDVGPRMRGMPTDGTPPVPSMEAVLGNDFRSFGSPVMEPQEEAISTSHITQLMPGTARGLGVFNSRDPLSNLRGGARYLRAHLDEFKRVDLALAAYNAGPGRVRSMRRIPPFRETMDYVAAITRGWSTGSFRTASIQTAGLAVGRQEFRGRGVQLLAYTSTRVSNPR